MAKGLKTGGRKKGTPNKDTSTLVERLSANGVDIVESILKLLPRVDESQRLKVFMELMQYQFPKRKAIEMSATAKVTTTFEKLDGTGERYSLDEGESDE